MALSKNLKELKITPPKKKSGPVWKGPAEDGITFSLLCKFLTCRERFRLLMVEGLKPKDKFEPRMEFGNMWHICEEEAAKRVGDRWNGAKVLDDYCTQLGNKFPMQREEIAHWHSICGELFPAYVEYWSEHPDVTDRTPLLQEQVFDVPYKLPSGRVVKLRGKWDSVDIIGKGKQAGIYIQENKTKSQIDQDKLTKQLRFDLQTMMYVVALQGHRDTDTVLDGAWNKHLVGGVRYNVIRRSAHKSSASMMKKVQEDIANGRAVEWFARWKVEVTPLDIQRFREQSFDPILEQLCAWWEWCRVGDPFRPKNNGLIHNWVMPYGIYNPLLEGKGTDLDYYMETGSEVGLQRTDNLFPELST